MKRNGIIIFTHMKNKTTEKKWSAETNPENKIANRHGE